MLSCEADICLPRYDALALYVSNFTSDVVVRRYVIRRLASNTERVCLCAGSNLDLNVSLRSTGEIETRTAYRRSAEADDALNSIRKVYGTQLNAMIGQYFSSTEIVDAIVAVQVVVLSYY